MENITDKNYGEYYVILDKDDLLRLGNEPERQKICLIQAQNWFNDVLRWKGKVYLRDVYKRLQIPFNQMSDIYHVGWRYDPEDDSIDNYVDFGLFDMDDNGFINGNWDKVILNFNADGIID